VDSDIETAAGLVPRVGTKLTTADRWGAMRMRMGIGRMDYRVLPGLYAVGTPGAASPVLVTANYKLTFDILRAGLSGLDAWILVLDTHGVNVWCAAGKGTFSTEEVDRVQEARLGELVRHRVLILPQLGAPGVAAHEVKRRCGFGVEYGPVRAQNHAGARAARLKKPGPRGLGVHHRDAESAKNPYSHPPPSGGSG